MKQWTWIEESVVWAVHEAQLAEHGGSAGVRDAGLLASALARPLNLAAYGEADAAALAAAYGFGIATQSPVHRRQQAHRICLLPNCFWRSTAQLLLADDAAVRQHHARPGRRRVARSRFRRLAAHPLHACLKHEHRRHPDPHAARPSGAGRDRHHRPDASAACAALAAHRDAGSSGARDPQHAGARGAADRRDRRLRAGHRPR